MTLVQRLVILVVVALAPVLAGVAYSLSQLREIRTQEIRADAERLVAQVDAQHRRLYDAISLLLTAIAIEAPRAVERPEACAALVSRMTAPAYRWLDLMVLDGAGIVRCSTLAGTIGADRAGVPEAAAALTRTDLVLGTLERQAFQEDSSMQAALTWHAGGNAGGNNTRGVVLATIRPYAFLSPMISDLLPPDAGIIVADRAGHILHVVPASIAQSNTISLPPALAAALRRPGAAATRSPWLDGSDRLVAMGTAGAPSMGGITIFAGIPSSAALHDLADVTNAISLAEGITMLMTLAIAYWGGIRYIRKPLGVLTQAALRWRDGDQTARVRLPGISEMAALGRVFDEMADATEQSERQIREAADLLNALIESSADAIFVKDRDGRYIVSNTTFARLVGCEREDLVGKRDVEMMGHRLQDRVRDIHAEILASRQPIVHDLIVRPLGNADAEPRVLQTMYAPIRAADGNVVAVAAIARDMTDERRAAADLRAAKDRAEAADESKTRFLAAASHDLRQPVQAAILFAGLISEHATENLRKPAEQLHLVLNDLRTMLDSLFDVSRYDTQSMRADIVAFPLQGLIDQSVAAVADNARAKNLVVHAQPTAFWARSDHALLGRMLGNIIQNAVRYTVSGSVRINVMPHDTVLRIAVSDTGPGIAAEDLSRIWQEFEQLHNPERDRRQGLGLGLAIVRRLSRILNHPVNVSSVPGQGTTFTIELPRAEPMIAPVVKTVAPPPPQTPKTASPARENVAVVVEDDPSLLIVLGMILEDNGWTVIQATDTDEAMARLKISAHIPEVILTDYRLRDGKLGTDAITAIRALLARRIPAIILTGDVSGTEPGADGPLHDADRLGDVTVLRKPVAAAELATAMSRAITATAG